MAKREKKDVAGAPAWMVTYGDMMTLLLCFFVIIVSMSELKKDQRFQDVIESIRSAFGYETAVGQVPIQAVPKNSLVEQLRRLALPERIHQEGDSDTDGIEGRVFRVTNVREGVKMEVGGRVSFDRFSAELKPEAESLIGGIAAKVAGHNTVINVRGHATLEPLGLESEYFDQMELSIARARAAAEALERHGVAKARIRIIGAGAQEPLVSQAYTEERRALNRRVEIVVTEALVDEYSGEPVADEEREQDNG
jgi:chemotaxis protein MotB